MLERSRLGRFRVLHTDLNFEVGRPSNMPQAQPIIEMVMQEAKAYHRLVCVHYQN